MKWADFCFSRQASSYHGCLGVSECFKNRIDLEQLLFQAFEFRTFGRVDDHLDKQFGRLCLACTGFARDGDDLTTDRCRRTEPQTTVYVCDSMRKCVYACERTLHCITCHRTTRRTLMHTPTLVGHITSRFPVFFKCCVPDSLRGGASSERPGLREQRCVVAEPCVQEC